MITAGGKELRLEVDILSDRATQQWTRLPDCPVSVPGGTTGIDEGFSILQSNGLLVAWHADGVLHSQLLRVQSSAPLPPVVVDEFGPITLPEGSSATFTYRLAGDLPPAGVEVLVERVNGGGEGDVVVVDGMVQRVMSRSDVKIARIAARTDADGDTDTAWVRVRILQADGGIDPNARTFTVTIPDRYTQPLRLLGDVNGDGLVNALDLDDVVSDFGASAGDR